MRAQSEESLQRHSELSWIFKRLAVLKKAAFTLAEVLITLGIIGVVAAITLTIVTNKVNDVQYAKGRQKALATIGEAGRQIAIDGNMNSAIDAEDFVIKYLSKKLAITKTCAPNQFINCGISSVIYRPDKNKPENSMPSYIQWLSSLGGNMSRSSSTYKLMTESARSYAFLLSNGYAVNLFYNPNCTINARSVNYKAIDYVCINAIYDMNGLRGPNQVGKDVGVVTVLYPDEESMAVAPVTVGKAGSYSWKNANNACLSKNKNYYLPTKEEMLSMEYNDRLFASDCNSGIYWTSSLASNSTAWITHNAVGNLDTSSLQSSHRVCCARK